MDTSLDVDDFKRDETSVIPITRKEFEDMTKDLIIRGKNLIDKVLKKAKLNRNDINIAFHVGGGCRMPMIKKMLNEIFPNAEHRCSIHPEELIAKGAALYAYERKNLVLPNFDYYFSAISILIAIVLMLSIKILIIC
uniref:Heat shock protein 70 n=1 Tax=Panagrolaimus sp. PS1159 TaxID=55785 RepID=A0AC35GW06_9BILA